MDKVPASPITVRDPAWWLACAAGSLGVLYAAMSAYWGAGGTAWLDTIGGTLAREGQARRPGLLAVVWATVVLKLAASGLGLLAVAEPPRLRSRRRRVIRGAAWLAAAVLGLYGGVLTLVGVLIQANVVAASAHADHRALQWHAFLWDPWFLVWGLLLAAALALTRRRAGGRRLHPGGPSEQEI